MNLASGVRKKEAWGCNLGIATRGVGMDVLGLLMTSSRSECARRARPSRQTVTRSRSRQVANGLAVITRALGPTAAPQSVQSGAVGGGARARARAKGFEFVEL